MKSNLGTSVFFFHPNGFFPWRVRKEASFERHQGQWPAICSEFFNESGKRLNYPKKKETSRDSRSLLRYLFGDFAIKSSMHSELHRQGVQEPEKDHWF
jgi:hypothetical protein